MAAIVGCRRQVQHLTSKPRRKKSISYRSKLSKCRRIKAAKRRHSKPGTHLYQGIAHTTNASKAPKDRNVTENLIISCYFRKYHKKRTDFIPADIIRIIIKFMDSMELYLQRLCHKMPHTNFGRIYKMPHDEINIDYFIKKRKFNLYCNHCGNTNCLKFMQSHREAIDDVLGFKNNANEYECSFCHFFTLFNVKLKVLKYEICPQTEDASGKSQDTLIHYVTPFRMQKNAKFISKMIERESMQAPEYCPICYTSSVKNIGSIQEDTHCMEIFGVFRNNTNVKRNVFHCNVCDLYIHKMIETNSSVSY